MRSFIKHTALFCVVLASSVKGRAQDDARKVFEGGIIFGANITQVVGDGYAGYHKIGIEAGGQVYVNITSVFGISMDMLYAQKGARGANVEQSVIVGTYFDKYYLNLNYVEIPLMLHLNLGFNFEAGISYGRLIISKEWAEADVPVVIDPVINKFNSNDFEYVLGISRSLGKRWQAGARYEYSTAPVRDWYRVPARYSQYGKNEFNAVTVFRLIYKLQKAKKN